MPFSDIRQNPKCLDMAIFITRFFQFFKNEFYFIFQGKEYETRLRELKPGEFTDDLRTALGMPLGNNASKVPPPW